MVETKVIYHIDDESTPYLVKIARPSSEVTLRDFKMVLNKQATNYKYFFKSIDADFGAVKEEIADESTILPCFNGRVVSWLVTADGSNQSENCSELPQSEAGGGCSREMLGGGLSGLHTLRKPIGASGHSGKPYLHMNIPPPNQLTYQNASVMSSDLDSTSLFETESEITIDRDMAECSRLQRLEARKKPQRRKKRAPTMSRTSSYSSITDSSMSLNIITVSINMESVNFLGISIVGQSNGGGDGGIYVGSIMKGGAVALDRRIETGDMILQVNDINFENMTNEEAVLVLRDVVQKPGPIKLVVAKCWDPNPTGYFTIPRTEPVRPIDPGAWVAHTQALRSQDALGCHLDGTLPGHSGLGSIAGGVNLEGARQQLNRDNLEAIVKAMTRLDSGLEIRNRMWLKIVIPNAFIGADAVNWVIENVEGASNRREARRIVSSMLRSNLIKHAVNKLTFSEQCYYVLSDGKKQSQSAMSMGDTESIASEIAPLPNPPVYVPYSGASSHGYQPIQYGCIDRYISSGSSSSDVLTSKDMSVSQSDITSIIQPANHMAITNESNKSPGSSNLGGMRGGSYGGNDQDGTKFQPH